MYFCTPCSVDQILTSGNSSSESCIIVILCLVYVILWIYFVPVQIVFLKNINLTGMFPWKDCRSKWPQWVCPEQKTFLCSMDLSNTSWITKLVLFSNIEHKFCRAFLMISVMCFDNISYSIQCFVYSNLFTYRFLCPFKFPDLARVFLRFLRVHFNILSGT